LERLDNQTINKLFESITPEITNEISEKDDFDFHTSSIIKLLGIKGSLKTAQTLIDDFDFHTSSIIKLLGIKGSLKTAQTLISGEFKKILG